jgi:hypothetical protein
MTLEIEPDEDIAGAVAVTLRDAYIEKPRPPDTYLGVALALLPGIDALMKADPVPSLPLALLTAHATECGLKAALSLNGDDRAVRDRDVMHNLVKLWQMALPRLPVRSVPPDWLTTLGGLHIKPYYLRYSEGVHAISLPSPEVMVAGLKELLKRVDELIHRYREANG